MVSNLNRLSATHNNMMLFTAVILIGLLFPTSSFSGKYSTYLKDDIDNCDLIVLAKIADVKLNSDHVKNWAQVIPIRILKNDPLKKPQIDSTGFSVDILFENPKKGDRCILFLKKPSLFSSKIWKTWRYFPFTVRDSVYFVKLPEYIYYPFPLFKNALVDTVLSNSDEKVVAKYVYADSLISHLNKLTAEPRRYKKIIIAPNKYETERFFKANLDISDVDRCFIYDPDIIPGVSTIALQFVFGKPKSISVNKKGDYIWKYKTLPGMSIVLKGNMVIGKVDDKE